MGFLSGLFGNSAKKLADKRVKDCQKDWEKTYAPIYNLAIAIHEVSFSCYEEFKPHTRRDNRKITHCDHRNLTHPGLCFHLIPGRDQGYR